LNQLFQGEETPENLQLYRELIVEANTQLGFFSMPDELFGKYKEIIKMTSYESMKEAIGEDPRKAYKRMFIEQQNKQFRHVYT
jgi:hypothetical protein